MADTKFSALPAAAALGGTEQIPGVQTAAGVAITPAQIKTYTSASPTLVTPNLGTPSAGVLTSCTGLPVSTGIAGLGTGVATALAVNVGSAGAFVTQPAALTGNSLKVLRVNAGETAFELAAASGSPAGASGTIQYNNASSFGGMSGTAWDDTNRSLAITGATVTTNKPILDLSQTWNDGAVTFIGLKVNITKTASAGASLLFDFQFGGVSHFWCDRDGYPSMKLGYVVYDGANAVVFASNSGMTLAGANNYLGFAATNAFSGADIKVSRVAAGVLKVTDGSTGAGVIQFQPVTVASLPSAATAGQGARAHVTDASTTLILGLGTTVTGGGANSTPVWSDGSNWKYG